MFCLAGINLPIDIDSNKDFATKYGVRNIPTVLIFKDGEVAEKQVGVAPKNTYADKLNGLLANA